MSSAVLRTNDRTSVNDRRSGDKSSIRDATARFKQFGHTVRMEEIRGTERFEHQDREGMTRKQGKVTLSQERVGFHPHSSDLITPTEQNTGKSSVSVELGETCAVKNGQVN